MLPDGYQKRSFLRFHVPIDLEALRDEFRSIPNEAWVSSYWGNIHCSIGMLLLRGGDAGGAEDFFSDEVIDKAPLAKLPYIESLLGPDGPFGAAVYAFLFRMEPRGVTLGHQDQIEKWHDMFRIHVPIVTNRGAFLISDNRSIHFEAGHAWSFDNQTRHGVVNGPATRTHLIFDVEFSETLAQRIDAADFLPGKRNENHVKKINSKKQATTSYPGDRALMQAMERLRASGYDDEKIAEFLNAKGIPTRRYHIDKGLHSRGKWDARAVREITLA